MFTINGKKVLLSSNETIEVLKGKISVVLNTIPPFLDSIPPNISNNDKFQVPDPFFFIDQNTVKMRDSLTWDDIAKVEVDLDFLKKLYIVSKIQTTIDEFGIDNKEQAINYAFFNLETELDSTIEINNIWRNKDSILNEFKNMVFLELKNVEKQTQIDMVWTDVKPSFLTSPFILNKINHQTEIPNLLEQNELMIFDSIKLNNVMVACFYLDMIKYNPDYKHLIDEYLNQDKILSKKLRASDVIRVMLNLKEIVNTTNIRIKYKMINIFARSSPNKTITFTIETLINEANVSANLKNIIKKIILDMRQEEAYNQRNEREFYYGSYTASINVPLIVLKDLITNDHNVYNISYINESALINTRKLNLNIFLKSSNQLEDIGISLFERIDVGTFIRLKKIKGGSDIKERINTNMDIVNKILQYTFLKAESILNYYNTYITIKSGVQIYDNIDRENVLKNQVPEIFLSNYTRLCNKPPIIVSSPTENKDEMYAMKFPIYGESEPKYYECPYPDFKYPGLRENTKLANRNIYPYIPCCYQRPQLNSKNYKLYFNQENFQQRINSGEIGKTLKILSPKRIGSLPPKIDKLLSYVTGSKYYRYGVPLSFISCIDVLNMVTSNYQSEEVIRSELAKRASMCKGEFHTLNTKEISEKIMDQHTYINPRYFKGALEDYYNLTFILFSIDKDDFSEYPSKFLRFICPLKKKIIFLIEHEQQEHVELIIDEATLNYVNKLGKRPIYVYEKSDRQVQKIFSMLKKRFNYILYDVENQNISSQPKQNNLFNKYPWEYSCANGKIMKYIEPLTQYVDSYGQTRLLEFKFENTSFVGQFQPLPCLKLPVHDLQYFIAINNKLQSTDIEMLNQKFPWCPLYLTKLNITTNDYSSTYFDFKKLKNLAEYILWAACHVYSKYYEETGDTVDSWIDNHTQIIENFSYENVVVKPIFDLSVLMVNDKFIFNSLEFEARIAFNLKLISTVNLKLYLTNVYHSFYNDISNFTLTHPIQLALTKQDYFKKTRDSYHLNILTTKNLQYIKFNTLYFIKDLFGYYNIETFCLFFPSLEDLIKNANKYINKVVLNETLINVLLFNQNNIQQYSLGQKEPSINIMILNINEKWFYGLILPSK